MLPDGPCGVKCGQGPGLAIPRRSGHGRGLLPTPLPTSPDSRDASARIKPSRSTYAGCMSRCDQPENVPADLDPKQIVPLRLRAMSQTVPIILEVHP